MASINQNIVIFDHDFLTVRFNVSDAVQGLNGASSRAWWGISTDSGTAATIEKSSAAWASPGPNFGSSSEIDIDTVGFDCFLLHDDTNDLSPSTEYYHELVFTGTNDPDESLVISTGAFFVSKSIFTSLSFR